MYGKAITILMITITKTPTCTTGLVFIVPEMTTHTLSLTTEIYEKAIIVQS